MNTAIAFLLLASTTFAAEIKVRRDISFAEYLVKLYIDPTGKLQKDFTSELSDDEFVGQVEVESGWPVGYGQMTVVNFPMEL